MHLLPAVEAAALAQCSQGIRESLGWKSNGIAPDQATWCTSWKSISFLIFSHGSCLDPKKAETSTQVACKRRLVVSEAPTVLATHCQGHGVVQNGPCASRILRQELIPGQGVRKVRDEHPGQGEASTCSAGHGKDEPRHALHVIGRRVAASPR